MAAPPVPPAFAHVLLELIEGSDTAPFTDAGERLRRAVRLLAIDLLLDEWHDSR